ncbi:MAG: heat-shock protein Hsp20 [Candidatus Lloydbacteria bacterium CG22_combo_CG10-13_8_21_14_all_47_15]|uniref:Heat-shock protein Hsp20 n=1 Tax=Candidatus Lloydbacteria bacterium CG22_combo_CG10-13_8_21_14_all_47_15 TaxID=1974635 RepID=A0A2H0CTL5_9BACT|nr:MAG: heat-shock protein Hsp20 [Candidatus Lloydbacteria bacterium CG22_combo_CG10-13_8_21_14_all_47_15]
MFNGKKSFFEKLTGATQDEDDELMDEEPERAELPIRRKNGNEDEKWMEEEAGEGQLAVDVYQTPEEIIIETMVAGVKPDDLHVSISRDMVTVKGRRESSRTIKDDNYFHKELYWGSFSRTVLLPQEIDPDLAEATEKHGLLTLRLPKLNKEKTHKLKVKSM